MTLARRVIVEPEMGQKYTTDWSVVFPFCDMCGVILFDERRHDDWHALNDDIEEPDPNEPYPHPHRWLDHKSGSGVFCGDCPATWGVPFGE